MILCKVKGAVVATRKSESLRTHKILIVQPLRLDGSPGERDILALDTVDAGAGDIVLVLQEGESARQVLGRTDIPVHSLIVAVVDGIDLPA